MGRWQADAQLFWNETFYPTFREIAYRYGKSAECPYPFYEIRRDHVLALLAEAQPGRLLDVGVGGGHVSEVLSVRGWTCEGCDFASNMLDYAHDRLAANGAETVQLRHAAATDLLCYADQSFDAALCLGPIEYLSAAESEDAYAELARVVRPGGILICAHINLLFDFLTMDAFTARLTTELVEFQRLVNDTEQQEIRRLIRSRLNMEESGASKSIRSRVKTRADNPLTIRDELAKRGFAVEDLLFYRFYAAPPFVLRQMPELAVRTIQAESDLARDWRGNFLASSFLTLSRKV